MWHNWRVAQGSSSSPARTTCLSKLGTQPLSCEARVGLLHGTSYIGEEGNGTSSQPVAELQGSTAGFALARPAIRAASTRRHSTLSSCGPLRGSRRMGGRRRRRLELLPARDHLVQLLLGASLHEGLSLLRRPTLATRGLRDQEAESGADACAGRRSRRLHMHAVACEVAERIREKYLSISLHFQLIPRKSTFVLNHGHTNLQRDLYANTHAQRRLPISTYTNMHLDIDANNELRTAEDTLALDHMYAQASKGFSAMRTVSRCQTQELARCRSESNRTEWRDAG